VARFWADQTGINDPAQRRARLERFFFDGIDGFPPVLRATHLAAGAGGLRTLQTAGLLVVPGLLENTPFGTLYNSAMLHPLGDEYRQFFISQVATLAIGDVSGFFDRIPDKYLMHESNPDTATPHGRRHGIQRRHRQ